MNDHGYSVIGFDKNSKQVEALIGEAAGKKGFATANLDEFAWLPANLIQAQRDDFGAHKYERNDRQGIFHTQWNQTK